MDTTSASGTSPLGLTGATCSSPVADSSIESKWRNICPSALHQIVRNCQSSFTSLAHLEVKEEAIDYVSSLMLQVVRVLMSSSPHSLPDLERSMPLQMIPFEQIHDYVKVLFPNYEKEPSQKNQKRMLSNNKAAFSFTEVNDFLKSILGGKQVHIDPHLAIFVVAALQYVANEIFKITSKYVLSLKQTYVGKEDISVALNAGKQLLALFSPSEIRSTELPDVTRENSYNTYEDAAKAFVEEEKSFLRDVRVIIKVFRVAFDEILSREADNASSLPSSPTSLTSPDSKGGQWSVPSSPTHKTPLKFTQEDINCIFSNISDIEETSINLLCGIEDALEAMTSADSTSADRQPKSGIESIGSVFEDIAEALEFDVFETFARDVLSDKQKMSKSTEKLLALLADNWVSNSLSTAGSGFLPAIRYVLPKFLSGIVLHAFTYFEYIEVLRKLSPSEEDRESFAQAEGLLNPLKKGLEEKTPRKPRFGEHFLRLIRPRVTPPLHVIPELLKVDPIVSPHFHEFLHEGTLFYLSKNNRWSERHAFLFDPLLVLCKPAKSGDLRIKEKINIKRLEVVDLFDTPVDETSDTSHANNMVNQLQQQFKLISLSSLGTSTTSLASTITSANVANVASTLTGGQAIFQKDAFAIKIGTSEHIFHAPNSDDKNTWMSHLVYISTKSLLERRLDTAIAEEERKNPLQMPDLSVYPFSEPDSETNILFEESSVKNTVPLIRGATLIKLVERLTYHKHGDPVFLKVFLTTFRSFCSPNELLDLLVKRFEIPELTSKKREDIKRYENSFVSPIQIRVLNVIRHWVDHHYYDFARDPELLDRTTEFLNNIVAKKTKIKKWSDSILRSISKKRDFGQATLPEHFTFNGEPPEYEIHLTRNPAEFNILTIHPIEFARQLTLLEFELFRRIQPSELVKCVWTKVDKESTAPNLLKMIHFTTNITYWYEQQIVETANLEERIAIYCRIIEILQVLKELNNFNGVIAIDSAMKSAPVFRLENTKAVLKVDITKANKEIKQLKKALDDASELNAPHFSKYQETLRSINPPCVPFLGMYLTNIVHIEDGNPDNIQVTPDVSLINFAKRRKVAEITCEIQQYQNTPYCLKVHHDIRSFIENINPQKDFKLSQNSSGGINSTNLTSDQNNLLETYFFNKSLEIEPRKSEGKAEAKSAVVAKFERKWPNISLKSPGIKPSVGSVTLSRTKTPKTPASTAVTSESVTSVTPSANSGPSTPVLSGQSNHTVFASVLLGSAIPSEPPPLPPRTMKLGPKVSDSNSPPPLPPRGSRGQGRPTHSSHRHLHMHSHTRFPQHHTMHFPSSSIPFTRNNSFSEVPNSLPQPLPPPLAPAPATRRHSSATTCAATSQAANTTNTINNNVNNNNQSASTPRPLPTSPSQEPASFVAPIVTPQLPPRTYRTKN